MYNDTIAAIATPQGEGALGVVRISGADALLIAKQVFRSPLEPRLAVFGRLVEPRTGSAIDDVVAVYFAAPRSYTGEDTVEFSCHGGMLPVQRTLEVLLKQGARAAEPGEFTLRAFLNGRTDLAQAEAVMDVVTARTSRAMDAAVSGLHGGLSTRVQACRSELLDVLAYLTASADFPEEGIATERVVPPLTAALDALSALLATATEGGLVRGGVRAAIVGLPNAGKSSLLNRLLGWERAIVSPAAGTTRDTLSETIAIKGIPFVLTDTAGINSASVDTVEDLGMARSRQEAEAAAVVVVVVDGSRPPDPELRQLAGSLPTARIVLAVNKCDLPTVMPDVDALQPLFVTATACVRVSALTGEGLDSLRQALVAAVLGEHAGAEDRLLVANPRHAALLMQARAAVESALAAQQTGTPLDLVAIDVTAAVDALGQITGETATADLLDRIFSRFCIGK